MKISQAKEYLHLVQGLADGKMIQTKRFGGGWIDWALGDEITFDGPASEYRIKPEPKLRAWKPEEVPLGAIARSKRNSFRMLIAYVHPNGSVGSTLGQDRLEEFLNEYEHSLDNGKTWLPCGVEDSE